jgi:hypothetical protein
LADLLKSQYLELNPITTAYQWRWGGKGPLAYSTLWTDTSHGNRVPDAMHYCNADGVTFDQTDMDRIVRTLLVQVYAGTPTFPYRTNNSVTGDNSRVYDQFDPYQIGHISTGWQYLALHDATVRKLYDIFARGLINGVPEAQMALWQTSSNAKLGTYSALVLALTQGQ